LLTTRSDDILLFESEDNIMLKIVAVADLHGRLPEIPECDVLLIAGDICPDISFKFSYNDPDLMALHQRQWLREEYAAWERNVPAQHILAVPGNHDWIDSFPESCRSRMFIDAGTEIDGVSFWFTPWVAPCGPWNYQLPRDQRKLRFADLPYRVDFLVMHGPAHEVGDRTYGDMNVGCPEMRAAIYQKQPRRAVFGHIHEGQRDGVEYQLGGSKLYHVSLWNENTWKAREICL